MHGLTAGSSFGPYQIVDRLGRGGMASVYRAYDAALDRHVALKVLPPESVDEPATAERFDREAKMVARLEHPNIVPIFAYGIEPDSRIPWMAMRLIGGGSLSDRLKNGRLPLLRAVEILEAVAEALHYAHQRGVVHRDIKPQNILLDDAGRVYLADFGIARMVEGSSPLTQAGMVSGTPQYMAPEQAIAAPVDHRCDIYALGIVAYEMLVGTVPFAADTPVAVLMKHVSETVPLPAPGSVPDALLQPALKCLAKRPEDRWSSTLELARALRQGLVRAELQPPGENTGKIADLPPTLAEGPSALTPPLARPPLSRPKPSGERTAMRWAVFAVAAVLLAGGLLMTVAWGWLRARALPSPEDPPAVAQASPADARPVAQDLRSLPVRPGRGTLAVSLEVAQAVGAVTATVFVQLDLDGQAVKVVSLSFPADEQPFRRELVVIEDVTPGPRRVGVKVSSSEAMSAALEGTRELALGEGVNQMALKISFMPSRADSTVEFVEE